MSWKPGPDDWASPNVTVLILQYVKSLIFESVCLACTVCLVLGHLPPQAVSASVRREMVSLLFYTISLILVWAVHNEALSGCQRNTCSSRGERRQIPFVFCFPVHHKELLLEQPGTLLSPRLESNPIWEDLPCYLAERQDSNGIIPYDMLMPASDLDLCFLVFFLTSDSPSSL